MLVTEQEGPPSSGVEPLVVRRMWLRYLGVGVEPGSAAERSAYRARRIASAACIAVIALLAVLAVAPPP